MDKDSSKIPLILKSLLTKNSSTPEDPLDVLVLVPAVKPETFEELPGEIKQFSSGEEALQYKVKQRIFKRGLPNGQPPQKINVSDTEIDEIEECIAEDALAVSVSAVPEIIKQETLEEFSAEIKRELSEDGLSDKTEQQETLKLDLLDHQLPEELDVLMNTDVGENNPNIPAAEIKQVLSEQPSGEIKQEFSVEVSEEMKQETFKQGVADDRLPKEGKYVGIKRKCLSLREKIKLLNCYEKWSGSQTEFCKVNKIPPSSLRTILLSRKKIEKAASQMGTVSEVRKRLKKSTYSDLEDVLSQWVNGARTSNIPISGAMLQEKASQIAESMEIEGFRASNGWLDNFRKRHNLVSRIYGEPNSVNNVSADGSLEKGVQPVPSFLDAVAGLNVIRQYVCSIEGGDDVHIVLQEIEKKIYEVSLKKKSVKKKLLLFKDNVNL